MIHHVLPLALLASAAAIVAASSPLASVQLAQSTIRERITVRVQKMAPVAAKPTRWREHKGPKCVAPGDLAGVLISNGNLDMVMFGGKWLRARLDGRCRTLDFYSGIYLKPGADGRVCADRDTVRARSGAGCAITAFRMLEAKR